MQENEYLLKAIFKSGCIMAVVHLDAATGHNELIYISPNAESIGIDYEEVNKKTKSLGEYIHPDDREKVISTLKSAIGSKIETYSHDFRVISSKGVLFNVTTEIIISQINDEKYQAEFYIREVRDDVRANQRTVITQSYAFRDENPKSDIDDIWRMPELKKVEELTKAFSVMSELYSVVVDSEGTIVFSPVGPALNLGDYYDLFDTPAYKKYFQHIKQVVLENMIPTVMDREEGGYGKISAAPIMLNDKVIGFWILGSYTAEESEELGRVCDSQWTVAGSISDYVLKTVTVDKESAKSKDAEKRLVGELEKQNIINSALNKINSKLIQSADSIIYETLQDVGRNIDVENVFLCTVKKEITREYNLRSFWSDDGKEPDDEFINTLSGKMFVIEECVKRRDGTYVVDSTNMTEIEKYNLMSLGMKAMLVQAVYLNDNYYGVLFFAEKKADRVWSKEEISFTKSVAIVVQNMLDNAEGEDNIRRVNKHLIETYNNFNAGIFVREACSGKVLFSNNAMNKMLGYDFIGKDSRVVINNVKDMYDNISGVRATLNKEKVTSWKSYIKVFDDIMDIVEVRIEWLQGEEASLFIIRKAKDF